MEPALSNADSMADSERKLVSMATRNASNSSHYPPFRSCSACNRKKIRCDKKTPCCSSCTRSTEACVYPPLGRRGRRTKKAIMADMVSRISSLENALIKATDGATRSQSFPITPVSDPGSVTSAMELSIATQSSTSCDKSPEESLVQMGSSSQYFNEVILSTVLEDKRNNDLTLTYQPIESPYRSYRPVSPSPFNAMGILSVPSFTQEASTFHPSPSVALRLWNLYMNNVESCTVLKVMHRPTDEIKVYSTIEHPTAASLENLALCFAVYFAAAVSLDDQEAYAVFGQQKRAYLLSFKVGLEQAFAQGDFLDRPTLTGLLALAIYLLAVRVYNHGKVLWILNGLAIRIAQSLGLHRNGERLGLSPFESEMRRRLWWHFLSRDGRSGEDYGLQNTEALSPLSDVSLPLNVDDTDLHPDMKELPPAKIGWTAMTFSLINIDLAKSMQKLAAAVTSSSSSSPPSDTTRTRIITELKAQIDERLHFCNPVVPQHRQTIQCSRFVLRKLDFISRHQWFFLRHHSAAREDFATDENLVEALDILQPRLIDEELLLKQFAWARKAYPQYYIAMYILWHLCVKPEGASVDRAWEAIDILFSGELSQDSTQGFRPKLAVLTALRAKAISVRKKNTTSAGDLHGDEDTSAYLPVSMDSNEVDNFDINGDGWLNWETISDSFRVDGQIFPMNSWL